MFLCVCVCSVTELLGGFHTGLGIWQEGGGGVSKEYGTQKGT